MIEGEIRQYFSSGIPERKGIDFVRQQVVEGLDLRGRVSAEIESSISSEIAEAYSDMSDIFGLAHPVDFGLIYEWGGTDPQPKKDGYVLAKAWYDKEYGRISYSPRYLSVVIEGWRNRRIPGFRQVDKASSLRATTAHEMWHLRQQARYPKTTNTHSLNFTDSDGFDEWEKTWSERGAKLAGEIYCRQLAEAGKSESSSTWLRYFKKYF